MISFRPHKITLLAMTMTILLVLLAIISLSGFNEIQRQTANRTEFYRLRTGILFTNLRLRDAALTSDKASIDDELAKITPIRKESIEALEYFRKNQHTFPVNQRAITERILVDRMEYRAVQVKLIALIKDTDKETEDPRGYAKERWKQLQQYNLLMVEYLDKCDALISLSNADIELAKRRSVAATLACLGISILFTLYMTSRMANKGDALWRIGESQSGESQNGQKPYWE